MAGGQQTAADGGVTYCFLNGAIWGGRATSGGGQGGRQGAGRLRSALPEGPVSV